MEYVTYNEAGILIGSYMQDLQPEHQGHYIEVNSEQRVNWVNYRANIDRNGLLPAPAVEISLDAYNAPILAALQAIDAKTPRAMREALISGDTTRVQALEEEAAELRLQLRKD